MQGSAAAWQALQHRLSDAVCGVYAGMLRIAAVDAILSADRRMSVPAWLLEPFQVCFPVAWHAGKRSKQSCKRR